MVDIWNCYNMSMKKATNWKVVYNFQTGHCMDKEIDYPKSLGGVHKWHIR
ncbi:MAG: hypothetical protein ACLS8D_08825 [Clostridioides difficile]